MNIICLFILESKKKNTGIRRVTKRGWQTEQRRIQIRKILNVNLTSSDEECNDGFITHPPSWHGATSLPR